MDFMCDPDAEDLPRLFVTVSVTDVFCRRSAGLDPGPSVVGLGPFPPEASNPAGHRQNTPLRGDGAFSSTANPQNGTNGCERRSKSAARGGVARPVEKCSAQLCSDVGRANRGGAAMSPYRERGMRSVCRHGDMGGRPPPGIDRRVVEASRLQGVRPQLADTGEDAVPRRADGVSPAGEA